MIGVEPLLKRSSGREDLDVGPSQPPSPPSAHGGDSLLARDPANPLGRAADDQRSGRCAQPDLAVVWRPDRLRGACASGSLCPALIPLGVHRSPPGGERLDRRPTQGWLVVTSVSKRTALDAARSSVALNHRDRAADQLSGLAPGNPRGGHGEGIPADASVETRESRPRSRRQAVLPRAGIVTIWPPTTKRPWRPRLLFGCAVPRASAPTDIGSVEDT